MKRRTKLIVAFLTLSLVLAGFAGCGADSEKKEESKEPAAAAVEVPKEVQAVKDKVTDLAKTYAKKLDGDWGDQHVALIKSKEGEKYKDFKDMKTTLDGFREESGAYYIYALYPEDPESAATTDGKTEKPTPFLITVDGSEDPDAYGTEYEWEIQFTEAWNGAPAAARSAWADDDEGKDLCWSAFAPIHDSKGNVVAILGVDYPAPEILKFPEWNRDAREWNKIKE